MAGINTPRNTLKDYFKAGQIPLEENFADFIDVSLNQNDDGLQKSSTDPLKIQAAQSDLNEDVLRFYKDLTGSANWILRLNPTSTGTNRNSGLGIASGEGTTRLFINEQTGNIGLGHAHPHNLLDLGPSIGKKLALYQNAQGSDFYGFGISNGTLEIHAHSASNGIADMVIRNNGNVGIGTTNPGIQLALGDSDTGFQQQGDGELAIYTNNVERVRIDNQGRVGIGTNNPQIQLALGDSDTGFQQQGDGELAIYTNNGERVRVDLLGNVGIGTVSPQARLQVNEGISHDNNANYGSTSLLVNQSIHNGGNNPAATLPVLSLAREGVGAQAYGNLAEFRLGRYENVGTNSRTQMDIFLSDAAFAATRVMSLRANGHVGIGTDEPSAPLHIKSSTSTQLTLQTTDNSLTNGLAFQNSASSYTWSIFRENANNDRAALVISGGVTKGVVSDLPERMRITRDGMVGIGTNNPNAKLEVEGKIIGQNIQVGDTGNIGELAVYNPKEGASILMDTFVAGWTTYTGLGNQWQSFTLSTDTYILSITIGIPEAREYSGTVYVRLGRGSGGSVIHSQTYRIVTSVVREEIKVTFTKPILLSRNQEYTVHFSSMLWRFGVSGEHVTGGKNNYSTGYNHSFRLTGTPLPLKSMFSVGHNGVYVKGLENIGDHRNVQWNESTGKLGFDNSTRRHKHNIEAMKDDFKKILQLQPRTYYRKDHPSQEIGYIAEEVHNLGLTHLVYYDKENRPDGLNYEKICLYLLEVIREHEAQLNSDSKFLERYMEAETEVVEQPAEASIAIDDTTGLAVERKPNDKNTKAEIQAYLKAKGISFSNSDTKAELLKKIS